MVSRTVLETGEVGEVNGSALTRSFSVVPAHGVPFYMWSFPSVRKFRVGQRVELVQAKHSWLWGRLRWSATYVRAARR